jgi:hypothetical protein
MTRRLGGFAHFLFVLAAGLLLVAHAGLDLALFLLLFAGEFLDHNGPLEFGKPGIR